MHLQLLYHLASIVPALVSFTALGSAVAHARSATISAHVVDAESGEPIAAAALVLERPGDDRPVAAAVADRQGRAVFVDIAEGRYRLGVSAAGHEAVVREVLVGGTATALDIGRVALGRATHPEIVVTGERNEDVILAPGTNSFVIENNAIAQSGTVMAAMKGLPGVTVEREGQVLLRGSDRVTILIDGKASALTGIGNQSSLDSIPAANVSRIEIINNPSARHGAHGGAEIINIVMRAKRDSGLSGHVGVKGIRRVRPSARRPADATRQL